MLNNIKDREIQPFHEIGGNELICHIRKTPTVLYGIFVELMQQYWSQDGVDMRLYGTPDVLWDKDPQKSTIWIDSEFRWAADHPEFRPAIYVKIPEVKYSTIEGNNNALVFVDAQEAEYHYARVGEGSVVFAHVGSTAGEACALADASLDYLDAFSGPICRDFCFDQFFVAGRTPVQPVAKDCNEKYVSMLTCGFRFTDEWSLKLESPKLKRLVYNAAGTVARRLKVGEYWDEKPVTP